MYSTLLGLHSVLRWFVLAVGLYVAVKALLGWTGKRDWSADDDRATLWLTMVVDIQLLLGLLLYFFVSPITTAAFQNFGGAMSNSVTRFWAVEHSTLMILAIALVHVGRARSKKGGSAAARHRVVAICVGIAVLAMLAATPWPFSRVPRPLAPFSTMEAP